MDSKYECTIAEIYTTGFGNLLHLLQHLKFFIRYYDILYIM